MGWEVKKFEREVRLLKTSGEREERWLESSLEKKEESGMKKQGSG